jgi:hypothetical protein
MLRNFLGLIVTAGALVAPAIADEPVKNVDGKMLLTAAQMDRVTAGGMADAFASITPELIKVIASGEGDQSAASTSSTTMKVTYEITPDGVYIPTFETDYEGSAEADSEQANVQQIVVVPEVPGDTPPPVEPEPERVLTPAEQFAEARGIQSIYSVGSVNNIMRQARDLARAALQNR